MEEEEEEDNLEEEEEGYVADLGGDLMPLVRLYKQHHNHHNQTYHVDEE